MGKRPSKSTSLKLLQGARVSRRDIELEPKPRPIAPAPMDGLTAAERRAHDKLAKQLTRIGLVGECDGQIVSTIIKLQRELVVIWKKVRQALRLSRAAEKSGDIFSIAEADKHLQRWMRQEKQFTETFRRTAAEVGLTPRGRTGLKIELSNDDLSGEELLTKGMND